MTQRIYFGVQPQIAGGIWVYDSIQVDGWRNSLIRMQINDTTVVDSLLIYDGEVLIDTIYIYPESIDVVMKIGAEFGTNFPTAYFNEIRVIKE